MCFFLSLSLGSTGTSLLTGLNDLFSGRPTAAASIVLHVRLPRTLAALLAGSALAVSGVIIQTVLGNALASPSTIGVNAGAGFATLLCVCLLPQLPGLVPVAAFFGALLTALLIFLLAFRTGTSRMTMILAGVAISSILSAGSNVLSTLFPDRMLGASSFMMGGLSGVTLDRLLLPAGLIAAGLIACFFLAGGMDVLLLGEQQAAGLGVRVMPMRLSLLAIACILAGCAVSFSGLLGFVGLLSPHIARYFTGNDSRVLVPAAALLGGCLVMLCDCAARVLFSPFEIPVGIVLSLVGGPFFLYLLLKKKRGRLYDSV